MRDLNYQLRLLSERNRDGSYATRANRERMLSLMANQLWDRGFKKLEVHQLSGRHVTALNERWDHDGISVGTRKNRMAALRWWAEKVGRSSVIARANDHYGIPHRQFVTNVSKAILLTDEALVLVPCAHVRFALLLQHHCGLRREEALKFRVSYADQGDKLCLKSSWAKGGKPREIAITTREQRELLDTLHTFCGKGSLIPADRSFIQHLKVYERQCLNAGLNKVHGLRHGYAQRRYEELTGWKSRATGGPSRKELTREQKVVDRQVRLVISRELGHERLDVVAIYLGS